MPARAAYAAAEAEVLPVDAQMIALAPSSTALDTATVMPRSLNEPVGLAPSTLRYTSQPVRAESSGAGSSGVLPSYRVTTGVCGPTGKRSRNSSIKPRHMCKSLPFDAQHARDGANDLQCPQLGDGRGERTVRRGVRDDDQHGLVAATGLVHGRDADPVPGKDARDGGEHARLVGDVQ